jgi:predicted nuclease with TOPRIM domain
LEREISMHLHTNSRGLPGILYADSFESNLRLDENVSINFVKFKKGLYRIKDIKVSKQFVVALKGRLGRQGVKSRELVNKLSLQEKAIHRKDQEMLDLEMEPTMLKDENKKTEKDFLSLQVLYGERGSALKVLRADYLGDATKETIFQVHMKADRRKIDWVCQESLSWRE